MRKFILPMVVVAVALAVPWYLQYRARITLRQTADALDRQARLLNELYTNNKRLSNEIASALNSQSISDEQLSELLRLRNEASQLARSTNEAARINAEMRRIRAALNPLEDPDSPPGVSPLILYADELPMREARVAELRQWLQGRPEEVIPELQLLTESNWLRSADGGWVTDEDYRFWMTNLRLNAESKFAGMAANGLKRFAADNDGRFPATLAQLSASFDPPVDEAVLRRWEIVPANTLNFLGTNWRGGDWVITQKAPVNRERDSRMAIGLGGRRTYAREGGWDPLK